MQTRRTLRKPSRALGLGLAILLDSGCEQTPPPLEAPHGVAELAVSRPVPPPVPDPVRYPVWGIDVSHHQGVIDWETVARQPHLAFAYLKATQGNVFVDPRFAANWTQARQQGLAVGAYHFFSFCRRGRDQARHFLSVLPRDPDALPPVVDVEFAGNCAPPSPEVIARELREFLRVVERALHRRPLIYLTPDIYSLFLVDESLPHSFWLFSIGEEPPEDFRWIIWQVSDHEHLPGIDTEVDLDVFREGSAGLAALAQPR